MISNESSKLCFVIMPFDDPQNPLKRLDRHTGLAWDDFYNKIVKEAIEKDGEYKCLRADSTYGSILEEGILENLCTAHLVVAILSSDVGREINQGYRDHPNHNVMYELGLVHMLGRRETLLLMDYESENEIPFDIRGINVEPYQKHVIKNGEELDEIETVKSFRDYFLTAINDREKYMATHRVRGIRARLQTVPVREKLILLASGEGSMMKSTAYHCLSQQENNDLSKDLNKLTRRVVDELEKKPKCLLRLDNGTILERELDMFLDAGFLESDITIVAGYKPDLLQEQAIDRGLNYVHNKRWIDQEICGSLMAAIAGSGNEIKTEFENGFVVAYTDLVFENAE